METAQVEEVVQDFVSLKRRGRNLIGLCPFHNEKTPSFNVSPERNIFKCFGCGKGGNAAHFLMEHEQFSFPEAIRWLAEKYRIELEETGKSEEYQIERQLEESLYLVNQYALDHFREQLFETGQGRNVALSYFRERGFREEIIRKFGLGFAPNEWNAFGAKAQAAGYDLELLKKLGLVSSGGRDFFRNRVMFTIHNLSGKVAAFAGRILQKDAKAPKYINSPESEIYDKSKTLYGIYFAKGSIRKQDECMLVEGYTDVLSLHQAGIENVVASSGTSLTEGQIRLIRRYTENVNILYDGDPAGVKAALRGLDLLLEQGLNVRLVLLPEGEDPDSYLRKVGAEAFRRFLDEQSQDFILFKTRLLQEEAGEDPVKRSKLIRDIVESIARVPDPLKRSTFIRACAERLGVEEQLLVNETNKIVSERFRRERFKREREAQKQENAPEEGAAIAESPVEAAEEAGASRLPGEVVRERHIARVLMNFGEEIFDAEEQLTVAEFIISNIDDVLEEFDDAVYQQIVKESLDRLLAKKPVSPAYFQQHSDERIRRLAIDLASSPYVYSDKWESRWEIYLTTQKMPDENFRKDAETELKMFRLKKLERMIRKNADRIAAAYKSGDDNYLTYMKLDQRLKGIRNELAGELGIVITR